MKTRGAKQDEKHRQRIKAELKGAGLGYLGLIRFNSRYLPKIIKNDEHIKGAVYGRYKESDTLTLVEGMLVATERRVIFLNHKPGFTEVDEIGYNSIEDVTYTNAALFSGVQLITGTNDFSLRYAKPNCARKFVEYVEKRIFNHTNKQPLRV